MTVYQVTDGAGFVSGVYTDPYLVKNSGANTVYLGQDSSLTVFSRAFSLTPGSTLKWQGKSELWAITDTGLIAELEILYDSDSSFTPGLPGPDTVTALTRWDQLITGNFTHNLTPLQTAFWPGPTGFQVFDTTEYATVLLSVFATPTVAQAHSNLVYVTLRWVGTGQTDVYTMAQTGRIRIRAAVKGPQLTVEITNGVTNPPSSQNFIYATPRLVGTPASLPEFYKHEYTDGFAPLSSGFNPVDTIVENQFWEGGQSSYQLQCINGSPGQFYLPHVAGATTVVLLGTSVRNIRLYIPYVNGAFSRYIFAQDSLTNLATFSVTFPRAPIALEVTSAANLTRLSLGIVTQQ